MAFLWILKPQRAKGPPEATICFARRCEGNKFHIVQYLGACGKFSLWQTHFWSEAIKSNTAN